MADTTPFAEILPRRVSVVGGSCSGKTTLARELAAKLGVAYIELDALHHGPDWAEASAELLSQRVEEALLAAPDGWVVDGNYHGKLGLLVFERADTAVFLDLPYRTVIRRVLWRTLSRALTGQELWNGNRETWKNALSRRSIVLWVLKTHRSYPAKITARAARCPELRLVRLHSAREARRFVDSL